MHVLSSYLHVDSYFCLASSVSCLEESCDFWVVSTGHEFIGSVCMSAPAVSFPIPFCLEVSSIVQQDKWFVLSSLHGACSRARRGEVWVGPHLSAVVSSWPATWRKGLCQSFFSPSAGDWAQGLLHARGSASLPLNYRYNLGLTTCEAHGDCPMEMALSSQPLSPPTLTYCYFFLILLAIPVSRKAPVRASAHLPLLLHTCLCLFSTSPNETISGLGYPVTATL